MLEQKLEKAKNTRSGLVPLAIILFILSLIFIIASIALMHIALTSEEENYPLYFGSFFIFFIGFIIGALCYYSIKGLIEIDAEINDILFKMSLPTEFCYDVVLRTHSFADIDLYDDMKKLCIRYVESQDAIEYKYKKKKKKYRGFVTVDFAKQLFSCNFFNDL